MISTPDSKSAGERLAGVFIAVGRAFLTRAAKRKLGDLQLTCMSGHAATEGRVFVKQKRSEYLMKAGPL